MQNDCIDSRETEVHGNECQVKGCKNEENVEPHNKTSALASVIGDVTHSDDPL